MTNVNLGQKPIIPITLVTTVFNENSNIEGFLNSYSNQSVVAQEFIIVDGGSTDGTVSKIKNFSIINPSLNIRLFVDNQCNRKYSSGPIAKGRNIAISYCKTEWVVVTDAGCELAADWLMSMYTVISRNDADVVSGWYEPLIQNSFQALYAEAALLKIEQVDQDNFLPSSRNIAFKKFCWDTVQGYPEKTFTAEDTLFDLLLKQYGFKFFFEPKAVVFWECPRSTREAWSKQLSYGEGDGYLCLFLVRNIFGYLKIILPIGSLVTLHKPHIAFLKYILLLANQIGYTKGLIKRLFHEKN
jgi:glycosyltransferase involved in cell wall biosynthesis